MPTAQWLVMAGSALYSATKAAMHSLTKSWADEYGPAGVRVNTVAPGPTTTEKTAALAERSSLARTLELVGERWTLLVLRDCLFGVRRFTDLRARLDIPRAVLATRQADLVEAGLLERREYRPGAMST